MDKATILDNLISGREEEIDKIAYETGLCTSDVPALCFRCRSNLTCPAYAYASAEVAKNS